MTDASLARDRAIALYQAGLYARPTWGEGKALPSTDHAALADRPPTYEAIAGADYSGGLAIINGTPHPAGGYILSVDIDDGPIEWPSSMHPDWLLVEQGTGPGKWHLVVRVQDQLAGQVEIRPRGYGLLAPNDPERRNAHWKALAEIKGKGVTALRSFPSQPPDKPRGYAPVHLASRVDGQPELTTKGFIGGLARLYERWGKQVEVRRPFVDHSAPGPLSSDLARQIDEALREADANLGPVRANGWQQGFCPFHDDRQKSLSVNFERGAWKCFAGCGQGSISSLGKMLGIKVRSAGMGAAISPEVLEQGPPDTGYVGNNFPDSSEEKDSDESGKLREQADLAAEVDSLIEDALRPKVVQQEHREGSCWKCKNLYDNAADAVCTSCGGTICSRCGACFPSCRRHLLHVGITEEDIAATDRIWGVQISLTRGYASVQNPDPGAYDVDWAPKLTPKNGYDDDNRAAYQAKYDLNRRRWVRRLAEHERQFYTVQIDAGEPGSVQVDEADRVVKSLQKKAVAMGGDESFQAYFDPEAQMFHCISTQPVPAGYKRPPMHAETDPEGFFINAIAGLDRPSKYGYRFRDAYRSSRGLALSVLDRPPDIVSDTEEQGGDRAMAEVKETAKAEGESVATGQDDALVGTFGPVQVGYLDKMFDELRSYGFPVLVRERADRVWTLTKGGRLTTGHCRWTVDTTAVLDGERIFRRILDQYGMRQPKRYKR